MHFDEHVEGVDTEDGGGGGGGKHGASVAHVVRIAVIRLRRASSEHRGVLAKAREHMAHDACRQSLRISAMPKYAIPNDTAPRDSIRVRSGANANSIRWREQRKLGVRAIGSTPHWTCSPLVEAPRRPGRIGRR